MASLQEQFPSQYQQWADAGGIESNFRRHLIALGEIKATQKDLLEVAQVALQQTLGMLGQIQDA